MSECSAAKVNYNNVQAPINFESRNGLRCYNQIIGTI